MNVSFLFWEIVDRVTVKFCRSSPLMNDMNFRKLRHSICPKNRNQRVGSNWRFDDSILFLWSFPNDIWGGEFYQSILVIILQHNHGAPWHLTSDDPSRCFSQFEMFWFLQNVNSAAEPHVIRARGELLMSGLMSSQTPKLCFHFLSWWMNSGKSRSP